MRGAFVAVGSLGGHAANGLMMALEEFLTLDELDELDDLRFAFFLSRYEVPRWQISGARGYWRSVSRMCLD